MALILGIDCLRGARLFKEGSSARSRAQGLPKVGQFRVARIVPARESDAELKGNEKYDERPTSGRPKPKDNQWGDIAEAVKVNRDRPVDDPNVNASKERREESFIDRFSQSQRDGGEYGGSSNRRISSTKSLNRRNKPKVPPLNLLKHGKPSCYGCGALLQTSEPEAPGYILPQTFELKKKHHQLRTVLCGRCRLLSQGRMIPAVGGVGGYGSGKGYVPAEQLRSQLSHLRHQKALVVKLVDIVDFNGSFLGRVRDLVGANPIILVITKVDLLPDGTDFCAVSDWLQEAVLAKRLNVISIHLTSSKAGTGISRVASDITRQRLGRDVYILGSANVGKSAFVTALLHDLSRRDPIAAAALRFRPIQSAMPGTTLGPIEFQAFAGGGKLYDTPGVHLHHRMAAAVDPQDVSFLAPRRRLRGYVIGSANPEDYEPEEEDSLFGDFDLDGFLNAKTRGKTWSDEDSFTSSEEEDDTILGADRSLAERALVGHSLFWGGVARIDVIKAPKDLEITFYGPTAIRIFTVPTEQADNFYEENVGKALRPPSANTVEHWGGLEKVQEISLIAEQSKEHPIGDIAISGLGWFTIERATQNKNNSLKGRVEEGSHESPILYEEAEEIVLVLHLPKAVEMFVRPSIPLGSKATGWYKYLDATDAELDARPQVFYSS